MRPPTHPGQILHYEYLVPLEMTQQQLATHLSCDVKTINRLIKGHTSITPAMALKLGAALQTSPEFWMNLQRAVDLFEQRQALEHLPLPLFELHA